MLVKARTTEQAPHLKATYVRSNRIRAFGGYSPVLIPVPRQALADVILSLKIDIKKSFFLNRGNDQPNIKPSAVTIKSATDFPSLSNFFVSEEGPALPIKKTIIFTNSRQLTQEISRYLQSILPDYLEQTICYFHALRSPRAKKIVLEQFRNSSVKILVSTEAAGMVCKRIYIFIS